ncbi:MAG: TIGR01244 family sulfur transferase [Hyphomicrobiaceae bacterium]
MNARRVTDELAVSEQISTTDVAAIAAAGFRSIVCNRPNGESPDQADFQSIEDEARRVGLEVRWQPVISGHVQNEDAKTFGEIISKLPSPVFAYCRSGTRCIVLWSLSQAGRRPTSEIIKAAYEAGYDLASLAPRLKEIAADATNR